MGIDIHWVFQAKVDSAWIDVPDRYDGARDYYLYAWLGLGESPISSLRGFPADFQVNEIGCHPVTNPEVLGPYELEHCAYYDESPSRYMGDRGFSWLLGSEILIAPDPVELKTIGIPIRVYNAWDKASNPESWNEMPDDWQQQEFAKRHATPENITGDTEWVVVDWPYDFTDDFRYFVDEIRRLVSQYGEVRFVFGFA